MITKLRSPQARLTLALSLAGLAAAIPLSISACSGGDVTIAQPVDDGGSDGPAAGDTGPNPGTDGGNTKDTGGGNDTGGFGDANGGNDTGPTNDSGGTCDIPVGGYPCDPNSIFCNNAACATPANFCCVRQNSESCDPAPSQCTGGRALHCDEVSDCPNNQICCLVAQSALVSTSECQAGPDCTGGVFTIQLCRTNSECTNGQPCKVQTCPNVAVKVEACGSVPTCN